VDCERLHRVDDHASSERRSAQAFDHLASQAVLLDATGRIVESNASWRLFAQLNDAARDSTGIGINYLDVCDRAVGSDEAARVATGVREILAGRRQRFSLEYPCPSPSEDRWFQLQASAVPFGEGSGVVLLHVNITARRLLEESLHEQADRDPLTGLPNRRAAIRFIETNLADAAVAGGHLRILYFDLDGFKAVNDTYGHPGGDEVLIQATARARHDLRVDDLLCRLGGDEFVIVCPDLSALAATAIAGRLRAALAAPFQLGESQVVIGVSIGIAVNAADQAMYQAKRADRPA
jgi:diguanylate cyclase (GGDEF)-like protein